MRLSISNIAWDTCRNEEIYSLMRELGYTGLEIAPTKFFPDHPYDHGSEFHTLCEDLQKRYELTVCSMQSILYGMSQNIFDDQGSEELLGYLDKAFAFGEEAGGCNFVFGCPQNRIIPENKEWKDAIPFFEKASASSLAHSCVLALEANSPVYGTNFVNDTEEAFNFVKEVPGLKVNLDFGTIIDRDDDLKLVRDNLNYVNHIHISEPGLLPIQHRYEHTVFSSMLSEAGYDGFVSVEMKLTDTDTIKRTMEYVREIFA